MQRLTAVIQNYEWGDRDFIAKLQSRPPTGVPEAELWMGAHPSAPSHLEPEGRSLAEVVAADPSETLGAHVAGRFGELPFLLKVLAAARPLSIQAHPSLEQAKAGFARENALDVPLDSPARNYRDPNHKPELICALTRFEAKCGFRDLASTRELFASFGSGPMSRITERLGQAGEDRDVLEDVLSWLLRVNAGDAAELAAATARASADSSGGPYAAELAWSAEIHASHPGDIGVVVALLLNHVVLEPGEAIFLRSGALHSYLRGAGIELMANSDNVVRGGLTSKPVDVEELLDIVDCTPLAPVVQVAGDGVHEFDCATPEFSLTRVQLGDEVRLGVSGPEVLLVTNGHIRFTTESGDQMSAQSGVPVWVPAADTSYVASGDGTFYRATVATSYDA